MAERCSAGPKKGRHAVLAQSRPSTHCANSASSTSSGRAAVANAPATFPTRARAALAWTVPRQSALIKMASVLIRFRRAFCATPRLMGAFLRLLNSSPVAGCFGPQLQARVPVRSRALRFTGLTQAQHATDVRGHPKNGPAPRTDIYSVP